MKFLRSIYNFLLRFSIFMHLGYISPPEKIRIISNRSGEKRKCFEKNISNVFLCCDVWVSHSFLCCELCPLRTSLANFLYYLFCVTLMRDATVYLICTRYERKNKLPLLRRWFIRLIFSQEKVLIRISLSLWQSSIAERRKTRVNK